MNLHHWIDSSAIQGANSSPEARNSSTDHRGRLRRRGKERIHGIRTGSEKKRRRKTKNSRIPNHSRKRRRKSPVSSQNSSQDQQQNQIQRFLKIQIESPNQNQVKSQTYFFVSFKNNNEFQNDVEQRESVKLWFGIINPNFFWKNFKIPRFTTLIHRCKPTNQQIKTHRKKIWTKKMNQNRTDSARKSSRSTSFQLMHVNSSNGFVFGTMKRSFWAINHGVLGWISKIRVRVQEHEGTAEKRKKKDWKWMNPGFNPFYTRLGRVDPNPTHSLLTLSRWSRSLWIWTNPTLLEC